MNDTKSPAPETAPDQATAAFRPEARAPRGFADKRARELALERRLIEAVSRVYESYGFEALATSALEYADALGKFLPDADRPNVGVFALQDDDAQWMALRYDLTAPLARFSAQNWETLPKPFRRFAFGPVWRNEKPGPGRLREFTQCDADTVGSDRPEADAELISMAVAGFAACGVPACLKINNRKLLNGLLVQLGVTDAAQQLAVLRAIDKLDRLGPEGVRALLGTGRLDESGAYTKGAHLPASAINPVVDFVSAAASGASRSEVLNRLSPLVSGSAEGAAGLEELARIDTALNAMGVGEVDAIFDPTIVRGLEYYTGCVFEAELLITTQDAHGQPVSMGSVGGGGRYDDLIARFTGQAIPATGFSFGVSRLAAALSLSQNDSTPEVRGPIVIINFSEADMGAYMQLAQEIRAAGMAAEVYLGRAGMKAQMKYADRRQSPAVVMMGEDELKAGSLTIKDLDQGRALSAQIEDNRAWREDRPGQVTLPRAESLKHLRKITRI